MIAQKFHQSGQVGIAVILVMVIMSTIGISLATRSASDVRTARQSQEATQTFSAAEAALEDILSRDEAFLEDTSSGQFSGVQDVSVDYTVGKESELNTELLEGSTVEVNVSGGSAGQGVVLEWSDSTNCSDSPAALLVGVVNTNGAAPITRYYGFTSCDRADGMELISTEGSTLARQVVVTLQTGDQTLRVTPIYNDTDLVVNGSGWTLPTQEFTINSVAQNQLGRETKAIEVERSAAYAPTILDYALVSGTNIIK